MIASIVREDHAAFFLSSTAPFPARLQPP